MVFLQYPPCSTCQKAKKWLDEHGIAYTDRHIKEQNPGYEELKGWYEKSGLPLKGNFLNGLTLTLFPILCAMRFVRSAVTRVSI